MRRETIEYGGSIPAPKTNRRILEVLSSLAKSRFVYRRYITGASFLEVFEV